MIAVGDGRNDGAMVARAGVTVAVIGPEGASAELLLAADVVASDAWVVVDGVAPLQEGGERPDLSVGLRPEGGDDLVRSDEPHLDGKLSHAAISVSSRLDQLVRFQ